jgi:hypothetical protein
MTYEIVENEFGVKFIVRTDEDGKVFWIPCDSANADYQAYLTKDEVKADEAKTK